MLNHIVPTAFIMFACLLTAACAAPTVASSGIQRSGRDSYTVYVAMKGAVSGNEDNSGKTRARALSDANAFCTKQGLGQAYIIQEQVIKDKTAGIVINFSCGG
jgi:hypothetical protein